MRVIQKVSEQQLKNIGMPVLTPKDWMKLGYNPNYSLNEEEWEKIKNIVAEPDEFNFDGLRKHNQILFYQPDIGETRLSLSWWDRLSKNGGLPYDVGFSENIYAVLNYADEKRPTPGWYLFTKQMIPGSYNKSWKEQYRDVKDPYEIPSLNLLINFLLMTYFCGIEVKDREKYSRVSDHIKALPIMVGGFTNKKLRAFFYKEEERKNNIGVYGVRKLI